MDRGQLKDFFRAGLKHPLFYTRHSDDVLANFVAVPGVGQCIGAQFWAFVKFLP
jgi:hypothetical protein